MLAAVEVWGKVTTEAQTKVWPTSICSSENRWADQLSRSRDPLPEMRRISAGARYELALPGLDGWVEKVFVVHV